jgi:hypothetical protein
MRFDAPRLKFGRRPLADSIPAPQVSRAAARRQAQLAEADDALAVLPGPGEAVHTLLTGRYDLAHVLLRLIDRRGAVDALRVATLAYSRRNLVELLALLDGGRVKALTLLASVFFRDHNGDLWQETVEEFRSRGQRAAAARSHCKVATFAFSSGRRLTLEGSANLTSNANREQLVMVDGPALHDWHSGWIDELVSTHEGEQQAAQA